MKFSGAGTILGQGARQDRECQSREREIKFFAGIGALFCPKKSFLQKKGLCRIKRVFCPKNKHSPKKKVFAGLGAYFCPKNPKMAQDTRARGGKSRPGGAEISPGGQLPPYFPRL